jgi:hypothetical protein
MSLSQNLDPPQGEIYYLEREKREGGERDIEKERNEKEREKERVRHKGRVS